MKCSQQRARPVPTSFKIVLVFILLLQADTTFAQSGSLPQVPGDFPTFAIPKDTLQTTTSSEGSIFLANFNFDGAAASGYYLMILNDSASPIFYRGMSAPCLDFKVQPNGLLTYFDESTNKYYALDTTYAIVDSFACGNGIHTDVHDLELLPNGGALLLGIDSVVMDMSKLVQNGNAAAIVIANHVQELDKNKNVVFDWDGAAHFNVLDARGIDFTAKVIDFEHSNSIDMDTDGNIILSSRHLDEVSKINVATGDFMWRFGGAHNQFTIIGDTTPFSHQHDAKRIANGNLTIFDNGNLRFPPYSRALEYTIDATNMTATAVWIYRHIPDTYTSAMGDVERMPNGNTFIGWGANFDQTATEIDSNKNVIYELTMNSNNISYRTFRQPWTPAATSTATVPVAQAVALTTMQSFPNPFGAKTTLFFNVEKQGPISLQIEDELGRTVSTIATGVYGAGRHALDFNSAALPSGTYYAVLQTASAVQTTKLLVTR
jgi:hypothetical protein